MNYSNILVAAGPDGVARITLNRPERRNALSLALLTELREALEHLGTRRDIGAVIVVFERLSRAPVRLAVAESTRFSAALSAAWAD